MCTPRNPFNQAHLGPAKWKNTTITAAMARIPSRAGNRRIARYSAWVSERILAALRSVVMGHLIL
jgi:hypothetical protein